MSALWDAILATVRDRRVSTFSETMPPTREQLDGQGLEAARIARRSDLLKP